MMQRRTHNSLRILGIVITCILAIAGCLTLGYLALFIVIMGGLSSHSELVHPRAAQSFYAIILAVVALITGGILIVGRLYTGIVPSRAALPGQPPEPALSEAEGAIQGSETPQPVPSTAKPQPILQPSRAPVATRPSTTPARGIIDRLVLAPIAQMAVSGITLFQVATRPFVPRNWTLMLLGPFILSLLPYVLLICLLLKRPDGRTFTFLVALLAMPILDTLFTPMTLMSYRRIYSNGSRGLLWFGLSALIYVVILALAYMAIRRTGLKPKLSSAILATVATFFYFFLIKQITPYIYGAWQ
jgi:hypothetical protein